ncbi:MAG: phosphatase PAP2 family protein [Sedimentisphaeraceae bacterium JB056]
MVKLKLGRIRDLLILSAVITAAFTGNTNAGDLSSATGSLYEDIKTLPQLVLDDMHDVYLREDNFIALSLAGAASIAMHNNGNDDKIADNFADHKNLSEFGDRSLDFIGGPGQHFAFSGLWYLIAAANDDELNKERAWIMLESLSVTGFTTLTLKVARDNETPNGKPLAWPSGHTSSSFTVASVLDEFYGPGVGIPAYILAGTVGYRMMETGDHWGSDVVFGAVLGYITGHSIAGEKKSQLKIGEFSVLPYFQPQLNNDFEGMGISFACRY